MKTNLNVFLLCSFVETRAPIQTHSIIVIIRVWVCSSYNGRIRSSVFVYESRVYYPMTFSLNNKVDRPPTTRAGAHTHTHMLVVWLKRNDRQKKKVSCYYICLFVRKIFQKSNPRIMNFEIEDTDYPRINRCNEVMNIFFFFLIFIFSLQIYCSFFFFYLWIT